MRKKTSWQRRLEVPPELVMAARPMRAARTPKECVGGEKCWVIHGAAALGREWNGVIKCIGCGKAPKGRM
jgi:hypothetical protein